MSVSYNLPLFARGEEESISIGSSFLIGKLWLVLITDSPIGTDGMEAPSGRLLVSLSPPRMCGVYNDSKKISTGHQGKPCCSE